MNEVQDSTKEHSPAEGVIKRFLRWLFCWRVIRRWLFVLACLATLIGLFYAVEDWRGKRAWEKCRRELEAKGEVLDWNAFIPAPVPDDQNIYKAPKMTEWFVKESVAAAATGSAPKGTNEPQPFALKGGDPGTGAVLVAEVKVVRPDAPPDSEPADAVLRLDDPGAHEQVAKLLDDIIGPWVEGSQSCVIVAKPLDQIKPANLVVQADTVPTPTALGIFLSPRSALSKLLSTPSLSYFHVDQVGSNAFRALLPKYSVYTATEYLARSQPLVPDFDMIRKALERPYARINCDYTRPYTQEVPYFVRLRTVVQILSERAQCYLLLGQPEAAWHELALVHDICHLLEVKPTGQPMTLVAAMIHVAISGLYANTIHDGLRLQAWREPQLAALQQQLADIALLRLVRDSLIAERAASCYTIENTPPAELRKLFNFGNRQHVMYITFAPRGWLYQNLCVGTPLRQGHLDAIDVTNSLIWPAKVEGGGRELDTALKHIRPYSYLVALTLPNFVKAMQTTARNQTLANEAYVACGLERYRLARGQYPETLEALVPQHAEKVPHDIIGGQPLKYRRTADGQFVLYSVGWNEKDDGGVPGKTLFDDKQGDWVWEYPAK